MIAVGKGLQTITNMMMKGTEQGCLKSNCESNSEKFKQFKLLGWAEFQGNTKFANNVLRKFQVFECSASQVAGIISRAFSIEYILGFIVHMVMKITLGIKWDYCKFYLLTSSLVDWGDDLMLTSFSWKSKDSFIKRARKMWHSCGPLFFVINYKTCFFPLQGCMLNAYIWQDTSKQ